MKSKFLIIGLTGSLGSGCSEVSHFISDKLSDEKEQLYSKQKKIEVDIRKHFEFIKDKTNEFYSNNKHINDKLQLDTDIKDFFSELKPDGYIKEFESKLKKVNRRLRELLIRRKLYKYFQKMKCGNFYRISMSSLIVKLILEHAIDKDKNPTTIFKNYCIDKAIPKNVEEIITSNAKKHYELIVAFNNACDAKTWNKDDEIKFDGLFPSLDSIKEDIYKNNKAHKEFFQDMGDNSRLTGNPFDSTKNKKYLFIDTIAREVNRVIKYKRNKPTDKINHFIIDSFRNPAEVRFFKKRYGAFYLCSLYASKEYRKSKLGPIFTERCDNRDAGKYKNTSELYKQDVPSCTLLADYAINSDCGQEHYKFEIIRFLTLIDFPGLIPPRYDVVFMNFAYSLSVRSTCLSRQVGAAITNSEGFLVAAGWNDVGSGQLGCSLVCRDDYKKFTDDGFSISNWKERVDQFTANDLFHDLDPEDYFCFKDLESKLYLNKKISKNLEKPEFTEEFKSSPELHALKKVLNVKRLEYARSLHAEENAILQAARFGGTGIAGGTIYTTTYPCELCSKKIYQAQLSRIVYTEPYPDSLSETIFLKDGVRQISIEQFEGVKSPSYFRLFKPAFDLKEYQMIDHQDGE